MHTQLRPDDVAIGRLHLRAPAGVQQRLQQELAFARWPSAHGESWVFIRSLEMRAPATHLSQSLCRLTREKLSRAKPPGRQSDVIQFLNYFEMLAYLLIDLAQGKAAARWYWQRWSHLFALAPGEALRQVLSEHVQQLPAITSKLHALGRLETVWRQLEEIHADQLLTAFCWHLGIQVPALAEEKKASVTTNLPQVSLALSRAPLNRWQFLLKRNDGYRSRYTLALFIVALEAVPLALLNEPEATIRALRLHHGTSRVNQEADKPASKLAHEAGTLLSSHTRTHASKKSLFTRSSQSAHENTMRPEGPAGIETKAHRPEPITPSTESQDNKIAAPAPHPTATQQSENKAFSAGTSPDPGSTAKLVSTSSQPSQSDRSPKDKSSKVREPSPSFAKNTSGAQSENALTQDSFQTQQGGLFYLLNFLNRHEVQNIMEQYWQKLPSGWAWLYRLGQTLQLDEEDSVVDFLCLQLGFSSRDELDQLAALPEAAKLNTLAQRWYAKIGVWHPRLLHLEASVFFDPSHLDIHTAMNNVQLPVRLSGLDTNPGWLSWLGKVVNFHYDT